MKSKPKRATRASRVKTKARRQLDRNPSEREVKDFIVGAIETPLAANFEQMGFSNRGEGRGPTRSRGTAGGTGGYGGPGGGRAPEP
jgi:hypothetical protein